MIGGNLFDECKFVQFTLEIRSKSLWLGAYAPYQTQLFEKISHMRDMQALTFSAIAMELQALGYASPRGCLLQAEHVFSIYRKGKQRQQRLNSDVCFSLVESDQ